MKLSGVMHMHSNHSYDGHVPLPELKVLLQQSGIQFACMTEHTDQLTKEAAEVFVRECRELSDDQFLFIPGFEVPYRNSHILHIGTTDFICQFADEAQLKKWREQTELVVLAHPVRNQFEVDEVMLEVIDGVEVWNQQYEGKIVPRVRSLSLLKELRKEKSLLATGGLDFHRPEHFGSPLVSLEAPAHSEVAILAELSAGRFSFGSDAVQLSALENWEPSAVERGKSHGSVLVIQLGKLVNKGLAACGLRAPRGLKRLVRSRV